MNDVLTSLREAEFNLEALVRAAGQLVTQAHLNQADGRVADVPDGRGVRYYQSSGLVAKPLRYDGRLAVYGYRHLLQLVAVKLLQAEGLSLAQVQQALIGMPMSRLENVVARALAQADRDEQAPHGAPPAPAVEGHQEAALGDPVVAAALRLDHAGIDAWAPRRRLVAEEVAPGVFVTIDTDAVPSSEAVLTKIRRSLAGLQGARQ